jgi:hypothetical protein
MANDTATARGASSLIRVTRQLPATEHELHSGLRMMKRIVVVALLFMMFATGCTRRGGMAAGGLVAGMGAAVIANESRHECDGDEQVGCGLASAQGKILGGVLVLVGSLIFLGSAAAHESTPPAAPMPSASAPVAAKTSLRMR